MNPIKYYYSIGNILFLCDIEYVLCIVFSTVYLRERGVKNGFFTEISERNENSTNF